MDIADFRFSDVLDNFCLTFFWTLGGGFLDVFRVFGSGVFLAGVFLGCLFVCLFVFFLGLDGGGVRVFCPAYPPPTQCRGWTG